MVQKKAPLTKSPPKKQDKKKMIQNAESRIVASAVDEAQSSMAQK